MSKDKDEGEYLDEFQFVDGIPFPSANISDIKNITDALAFLPKDGDIIIASYPKAGSSWLQYFVLQIIHKGNYYQSFIDNKSETLPCLGKNEAKYIDDIGNPRIYKHNFPYNMIKKNANSKTIYIYRNPEDTLLANYNAFKSLKGIHVDFDKYFEGFLSGKVAYGNYFRHVLTFYEHRTDRNMLLVSYENLHKNTVEEVLKIADFLGKEYFEYFTENKEVLEEVLKNSSFPFINKYLYEKQIKKKQEQRKKEEERRKKREIQMEKEKKQRELEEEQRALEEEQIEKVEENRELEEESDKEDSSSSDEELQALEYFRHDVVGDGSKRLSGDQIKLLSVTVENLMQDTSVKEEWSIPGVTRRESFNSIKNKIGMNLHLERM